MNLEDDPECDFGYITHVAIKYEGKIYSLPRPNRHHNVIRMIAKKNGVGIKGNDIQGFLDCRGQFLNRKAALVIAQYYGQLLENEPVYANELYSENLW